MKIVSSFWYFERLPKLVYSKYDRRTWYMKDKPAFSASPRKCNVIYTANFLLILEEPLVFFYVLKNGCSIYVGVFIIVWPPNHIDQNLAINYSTDFITMISIKISGKVHCLLFVVESNTFVQMHLWEMQTL